MNEELHDVEVELKGWGVGGKGEGAKLTLTFAFDVALGDSRPVARMLAESFPDLADAMQRGADEADREVELTWPARYLGGRRFTASFFGAPAAKRMGGATNLPALRFVDCVLSGKVAAKVKGDAANIIIKVSTPTETCADGDGDELGVRTLARLNHTNLFMSVTPQEADATDAENRDEAPKRRQLSFSEAVDEVVDAAEKLGPASVSVYVGGDRTNVHKSAEAERMREQINGFFTIVDAMQAVDTQGVEPLAHPVAAIQEVALRLRADAVSEPNQREANQQSAPAVEQGLFLVPKVIE
jgi:aspartyl-tRNA(Asn)/glutamyl-tRNA(Gln) amidotransferase subunit C